MKTILVSGGHGFIASHFIQLALVKGYKVIDVDCLTYAAHKNLPFLNHPNYTFIQENICNLKQLPQCDYVVHMAAESSVDNSIIANDEFIKTNILGTRNLLELIRKNLYDDERPSILYTSSDEVFGDTVIDGGHTEESLLRPSNPYAAAKGCGDLMVQAWARTYGLKYKITRCSNVYGPRQHEEKFIPKSIKRLLDGKKILLHGDGSYVRDWIYVDDAVKAIMLVLEKGQKNTIYNIAGKNELSNIDVAKKIIYNIHQHTIFDGKWQDYIQFTENRWGQDHRYYMNSDRIEQLGFYPLTNFNDALENLINDNQQNTITS